jgi:type I restriction enzyme S subunit
MSYLKKILDRSNVEWKDLSEISISIKTGLNPRQNFILNTSEANNYYVTVKEITTGKIKFSNKTDKINDEAVNIIQNRSNLAINDVLFSGIGTIGKVALVDIPTQNWNCSESVFLIKPKVKIINPKFLKFFLCSEESKKQYLSSAVGSTLRGVRMETLRKLQIPIPCPNNQKKSLEIQQELVRILETFTELTEELTKRLDKELIARKNQYKLYREQLFYFDKKDIHHLPMGDPSLGVFQRGKRFVKDDLISKGVPCIHYGEMYTYYGTWAKESKSFLSEELVESKNLRIAGNGDVVIVAAGETIEDIGLGTAWLGNEGVVIHDACFSYRSTLNPKYVAYFTRTKQFHDQIKKHISSGKISAINAKGLEKVLIPVPSPEVQERIVTILDKFDILTNSISESLSKEIELRKKQYEYYRDLLLTFPKN